MSWKKIRTKLLLDHPRLKVYEDIVELPDGTQGNYIYFGDTPGSVAVIARRSDGKFLVQKEYNYPTNERLYQFPGGGVNEGEAFEDGARREFAEEAKLGGNLEQLGWYYTDNRRKKEKQYVYLATDLTPADAESDPQEELEDFWFTEDEIDELIKNGEINIYSSLCAWSIYKAKR